jgi:Amt family ammonium transporter
VDLENRERSRPGHNGFMMICAACVVHDACPAWRLFLRRLVRKKNVLSVLAALCMASRVLVTILWFVCGYSFVFGDKRDAGGPARLCFSF